MYKGFKKKRMTWKLKKYKKKKKTKFRLPYFIRFLDNDKLVFRGACLQTFAKYVPRLVTHLTWLQLLEGRLALTPGVKGIFSDNFL